MRKLFALLALTAASVGSASQIPPQVLVVTECGSIAAVYIVGAKHTERHDLTSNSLSDLNSMAKDARFQDYIESGCRR